MIEEYLYKKLGKLGDCFAFSSVTMDNDGKDKDVSIDNDDLHEGFTDGSNTEGQMNGKSL